MFFFFMIGILIGIYLDQEFQTLPKIKPLVMATLQKLQQGADPTQAGSDPTNEVEKERNN